jgi:hypothetical protein
MVKVIRKCLLDQPLFRIFLDLKDPRIGGRCLHPLTNIFFITLCALVGGANSWKAIETFGKQRRRWLSQLIFTRFHRHAYATLLN